MKTYDEVVQKITPAQLALLATFAAGTRVKELEANADAVQAVRDDCRVLFDAGMVARVGEGYEWQGEQVLRTFDGYVTDVAQGYVNRLARERLELSREPVPPAAPANGA